jgi:hypothetical protein
MRRLILACAAAALLPATPLDAQQRQPERRDSVLDEHGLPREVAREVVELFNAPATLRVSGSLNIDSARDVQGDVAVLNGPLTIAGRVRGRVVAVNADVLFKPNSRVDGDVLVVGGTVEGRSDAYIGGELRIYRQAFYYRQDGERITADRRRGSDDDDDRFFHRWRTRHERSWSNLKLASAHTYNRVEGLPIYFGPTFRQEFGSGRVQVDALGIVRSADNFRWDSENIGHSVRGEFRLGSGFGVAAGGKLFDAVSPVEEWHLTDAEVGLASFFLHRDYRDYFDRHGGTGYLKLLAGEDADLTVSLSDQRWGSRQDRDPYTLFRNTQPWRANPAMDDAHMHVANGTLRIDTRNDRDDPWSGWFLTADYERGTGDITSLGARSTATLPPCGAGCDFNTTGPISYGRGFLDLRRYNRLAPNAQLNLRVVVGGWLHGDRLPLQRRLSVGGPGTLPGYDFRQELGTTDYGQCSTSPTLAPAGHPAECDRVALAQLEYRGDLHVNFNVFGDDDDRDWEHFGIHGSGVWVLFTDAGRGWLVGPRSGDLRYARGELPDLGTFRTDVGVGLEFEPVGFYIAKSVSNSDQPANFFIRVKRRF